MIKAAFLVTFMVYYVSAERSSYLDRYTTQSPYDSDRYNRYDYTTRSPYGSDRYDRYDYTSRRPSYQTDRWGDVLGGATTRSPYVTWGSGREPTDRWGQRATTDYQWTTDRWGGRGGAGSAVYRTTPRHGSSGLGSSSYDRNEAYVRIVAELKKLTNDKGLTMDGSGCDVFGKCDPVFKVFFDTERPNADFPGAREAKHYTEIYHVDDNNSPDIRNGTVKRDVCGVPFRGAVLRVLVEDKDDLSGNEVINNFDCKIEGEPGSSEYTMWHEGVCTTRKQSDKMKLTFRYKVYVISRRECDSHSWSSGGTTTKRRH